MPTARELLEQADALMRRNRGDGAPGPRDTAGAPSPGGAYGPTVSPRTIQREPITPSAAHRSMIEADQPAPPDDDVPLLTDAVLEPLAEAPAAAASAEEVPVLTDAVEEIDVTVVDEVAQGEPSYWELTTGDTSVLGPAPDSIAVVPPPIDARGEEAAAALSRDPLGLDRPAPEFAAGTEPAAVIPANEMPPTPEPAPPDTADAARVRAIAEEIGMQVLQRVDIFSDTALREQLGERLKPVVDRVSADLVAAINQHVGELLRAYIAEAIEREMESWRKRDE